MLIGKDGQQRIVKQITQRYESNFPVSNLTIGEYHNYAVGPQSILVHNESICEEGVQWLNSLIRSGEESYDDVVRFVKEGGFDNADDVLKKLAPGRIGLGNVKVLKKGRLKSHGIDAEALKADIVGSKQASKFNVAIGPNGDVILVPVMKGSLPPVKTPYIFDDLLDLFPLG